MLFILQDTRESDALSVEIEELKYELSNNSAHSYIITNSDFFKQQNDSQWLKKAIPVGTIEFVQSYLSEVHKIKHMSPIEIPKELRLHKFMLRNYKVVQRVDIPHGEYKFIKNASVLKQPTFIGKTDDWLKMKLMCNTSDLYQVSDVLNIMAEYRVIVLNNKILGIQFYDGDCTVMPNEHEIRKIKEMVLRYSQSKTCPDAYGMDIAIVKSEDKELNNRDLALIEIGPFVSMANYGCRGYFLPQLYQKGLQWYLKYNTTIQQVQTTD